MKRQQKEKTKIIQSILTNKEINSNRAEEIIKSAKIKSIMINIIEEREREREREREQLCFLHTRPFPRK